MAPFVLHCDIPTFAGECSAMPKPIRHVLVCTQMRPPNHPRGACAHRDAAAVMNRFAEVFQARGLWNGYLLSQTSCVGLCDAGPNVLVYPENVLYSGVTAADVEEIVESHVLGGQPLARLQAPAQVW